MAGLAEEILSRRGPGHAGLVHPALSTATSSAARLLAHAQAIARSDRVTGLPNRRASEEELQRELASGATAIP